MGLHIAAWLTLLFFAINSMVLEFGGIYSHPVRYLSFGPYVSQQQGSSAGGSGSSASAAADAASFRRKRGIASGMDSIDDIAALSPQLSWYYNWWTSPGIQRSEGLPVITQDNVTGGVAEAAGMEFVPMQWGRWGIEHLETSIGRLSPRPAMLLGFNEPTHIGQADLYPAQAAELWPYLETVAGVYGLRLGSPSAAGCGADCTYEDPYAWWDAFFGNCSAMFTSGCRVDFMAIHMYTCSLTFFQEQVQMVWSRYRRPIWVTEFNCPNFGGTVGGQVLYAKSALAYLNGEPVIERYAWFTTRGYGGPDPTMSLLGNGTSALTWLGKTYTNDSLVAVTPPASGNASANGTVQSFSSENGGPSSATLSG